MEQLERREWGEVVGKTPGLECVDRGVGGEDLHQAAFALIKEFCMAGCDVSRMAPRVLNIFKGSLVDVLESWMLGTPYVLHTVAGFHPSFDSQQARELIEWVRGLEEQVVFEPEHVHRSDPYEVVTEVGGFEIRLGDISQVTVVHG